MAQNTTLSKELSNIRKMDCSNLYKNIKMIQRDDDGITFGRKTITILESWKSICLQKDDITKSIKKLCRECVKDSELAIKTAALMSSAKLIKEALHGENLKTVFVNYLHRKFNEVLRKDGDGKLRALANLLGCFVFKTKGANTDFLLNPLTTLIQKLAKSFHIEDVRIFAIQVYLNGHSLKTEDSTKWCNILTDVRLRLIDEENESIKLWLLVGTGTIADVIELFDQFSLLKEDKQFMDHHTDVLETREQSRLRNLFAKSKESATNDKKIIRSSETKESILPPTLNQIGTANNKKLDSYDLRFKLDENNDKEIIRSSKAKKENISPPTLNQISAANNKRLDSSDLRLKLDENKRNTRRKSKLDLRLDAIRNK